MLLEEFGVLNQAIEKQYTLFYLLTYEKGQRNLKVEVSKRPSNAEYEKKDYFGIPMLVMKQPDMVASKLSALITRRAFASRDMFDIWFFLSNNWHINEEVVRYKTGMNVKEALHTASNIVTMLQRVSYCQG